MNRRRVASVIDSNFAAALDGPVGRITQRCPRCRKRHWLELRLLTRPAGEFTMHAACKHTGEPILVRVIARNEPRRQKWNEPAKRRMHIPRIEFEVI